MEKDVMDFCCHAGICSSFGDYGSVLPVISRVSRIYFSTDRVP